MFVIPPSPSSCQKASPFEMTTVTLVQACLTESRGIETRKHTSATHHQPTTTPRKLEHGSIPFHSIPLQPATYMAPFHSILFHSIPLQPATYRDRKAQLALRLAGRWRRSSRADGSGAATAASWTHVPSTTSYFSNDTRSSRWSPARHHSRKEIDQLFGVPTTLDSQPPARDTVVNSR